MALIYTTRNLMILPKTKKKTSDLYLKQQGNNVKI